MAISKANYKRLIVVTTIGLVVVVLGTAILGIIFLPGYPTLGWAFLGASVACAAATVVLTVGQVRRYRNLRAQKT